MSRINTLFIAAATAAAAAVLAGSAHAAGVLDQNNPPSGSLGLNDSEEWQQQVTAGVGGRLEGITLYGWSTSDLVQINTGSAFYSGRYAFSRTVNLSPGGAFIDTSSANIFLKPGQTFVIDVSQGAGCCNLIGSVTPYAGGDLFLNGNGLKDYTALYGDSLAFETYMSNAPEPTVWMLMIVGLGLAGMALRRRGSALAAA